MVAMRRDNMGREGPTPPYLGGEDEQICIAKDNMGREAPSLTLPSKPLHLYPLSPYPLLGRQRTDFIAN